jgi:hypothetical protein
MYIESESPYRIREDIPRKERDLKKILRAIKETLIQFCLIPPFSFLNTKKH